MPKRLLVALSASLCAAAAVRAATPTPFSPPEAGALVLYRGATVIDGRGGPARPNTDVLVNGDRIRSVFADDPVRVGALNAKVVDVRGRYLIPGLIDAHVHLATPPNRRQAEAVLRRDLYGGVTAVRDMADDLRSVGELTRESLVGEIAAPDIFYAALMAGPDFFSDPRVAQVTAGASPGQAPWMQAVTADTELPLAVARARGTNATAIKLYADLTPDLASRIIAEAHRQHLLTWAHATLYPARPSDVVNAGVDAVSHACLLIYEAQAHVRRWSEPRRPVPLDPFRQSNEPALARLFKEMARRGTILDATVWAYAPQAPTPAAAVSATPALPSGSCDDVVGGAVTRQAYLAGVPIDAGTDNFAPWTDPWPDLYHEMAALTRNAGMPPSAVIHSATLVSARAAGQEREMGSIEPGKLANLVVLAKDPLSDLENLRSVVLTVKRGRNFPRSDFVPLTEGDVIDF